MLYESEQRDATGPNPTAGNHDQPHRHTIEDRYNFHDASFRRHYQLNYSELRRDYKEYYRPAYRYGYELSANSPEADWIEVEAEARKHWSAQHPTPWDEVADAVRHGWTEERDADSLRADHGDELEDAEPAFEDTPGGSALQGIGGQGDSYAPLYRYGHALAIDPERTPRWTDVESEVKIRWEKEFRSRFQWEEYRDAVRHAWQEARNRPA